MKTPAFVASLAVAALLAGCAVHTSPGTYRGYEAGAEQTVRFGIVESVREVTIHPRETGVGSAAGAIIGSVAGSHVGRGSGEIVGAIGGAILGGIIGQQVERDANQRPGVEVTVLLDSGRYIAVVQAADEPFRAGERVRVLSGRGSTRVTH
jgi:outer membrane lipoprotein SlyB